MATATVTISEAWSTDAALTPVRGLKITVGSTAVTLYTVTCIAGVTATRLRITSGDNATGTLYGTYSFTGTPPSVSGIGLALSASTTYFLCCDNSGSNYANKYNVASPHYPYNSSPSAIVQGTGCAETGDGTGAVETIAYLSVDYSISYTATPSTLTLSMTEEAPVIPVVVSASEIALGALLQTATIQGSNIGYYQKYIVGTGTAGSRFPRNSYPSEIGLTSLTTLQEEQSLKAEKEALSE
jgi:hypothetical protein